MVGEDMATFDGYVWYVTDKERAAREEMMFV